MQHTPPAMTKEKEVVEGPKKQWVKKTGGSVEVRGTVDQVPETQQQNHDRVQVRGPESPQVLQNQNRVQGPKQNQVQGTGPESQLQVLGPVTVQNQNRVQGPEQNQVQGTGPEYQLQVPVQVLGPVTVQNQAATKVPSNLDAATLEAQQRQHSNNSFHMVHSNNIDVIANYAKFRGT